MPPDTGDLAAPTAWHAQELLLMREVMKLVGHPRAGQRDRTPGAAPARATAPTPRHPWPRRPEPGADAAAVGTGWGRRRGCGERRTWRLGLKWTLTHPIC